MNAVVKLLFPRRKRVDYYSSNRLTQLTGVKLWSLDPLHRNHHDFSIPPLSLNALRKQDSQRGNLSRCVCEFLGNFVNEY